MLNALGVSAVIAGAAVAGLVIRRLLETAGGRRPEAETTAHRDLMIAQNRALSGRAARPGEPEWDGIRRAPVDDDPGGGY